MLNQTKLFVVDYIITDNRLAINSKYVEVNYSLKLAKQKITITDVPIIFQGHQLVKSTSHKRASVVLKGTEKSIKILQQGKVKVFAVLPEKNKGKVSIPLTVELPSTELQLESIGPAVIEIEVQ